MSLSVHPSFLPSSHPSSLSFLPPSFLPSAETEHHTGPGAARPRVPSSKNDVRVSVPCDFNHQIKTPGSISRGPLPAIPAPGKPPSSCSPRALVSPPSSALSLQSPLAGGSSTVPGLLGHQHVGDEVSALPQGPAVPRFPEWTPRHTARGRVGSTPSRQNTGSDPGRHSRDAPRPLERGSRRKPGTQSHCLLRHRAGVRRLRRGPDAGGEEAGAQIHFCDES